VHLAFFGTPEFAVPTLQALHDAGHTIGLVISQPDKPVGRGMALQSPPVVERARALGLPVSQPRAVRSGTFHDRFVAAGFDVAVVIAYGRLLPTSLLHAPRYGCINLHASLLPRWRGAAPIQAAVLAGDLVSGVSAQRMVEALDEGPLYLSEPWPVAARATAGSLHDELSAVAARVAVLAVPLAASAEPVPQEGPATYAGKLDKDSGRLDWRQPALVLDRQVRAMTPWPGGWVPLADGPLKIGACRPVSGEGTPGFALATTPDLVVACGEGALVLEKVRAPGRKEVTGREYAASARLGVGDRIGLP
jgi:methionyl-tRNA formyltransferase